MAVHVHVPSERTPAHWVAIVLGATFILIGLAGFVEPGIGGAHLSGAHNLIHLVSGAASLYFGLLGSREAARTFCLAFGAVYGLLGVAGFLAGTPGTPSMPGMPADDRLLRVIPGSLELGTMDHALHIVLSGVYLIAGFLTVPTPTDIAHRGPREREAHFTP